MAKGDDMTLEVSQCWQRAVSEHGGDGQAVRERYRQLMRENGHLVEGPSEPLPCGLQPGPPSYSLADTGLCGEDLFEHYLRENGPRHG